MRAIFIACLLEFSCGCESLPKWNGFYFGMQNVDRFDSVPDGEGAAFYGNAIWNIGDKWSLQIEPIQPIGNDDGNKPLLRLAVDRKLF